MTAAGPVPALDRTPTRRAVREVTLRVRRIGEADSATAGSTGTRWRVQCDEAPGMTLAVSRPEQVAPAVRRAFDEAEVAAHSRWKGERYDLVPFARDPDGRDDDADEPAVGKVPNHRPRRGPHGEEPWRAGGSPREQHPADWTPLPDGRWRSPRGRVFSDPDRIRSVIARRVREGLPIVPVDGVFDLSTQAERIAAQAAQAGVTPHDWIAAVIAAAVGDLADEPEPGEGS